jgi:hypothetical protein
VDVRDVVLAADIGLAVEEELLLLLPRPARDTWEPRPEQRGSRLARNDVRLPERAGENGVWEARGLREGLGRRQREVRGAGSIAVTTAVWPLVALPEP